MKIVEPKVELVHRTYRPAMVVEEFARIAYQSFDKQRPCPACHGEWLVPAEGRPGPQSCLTCGGWGTDPATACAIVKKLMCLEPKPGEDPGDRHESVLEHVILGVKITTDRGVGNEQVRHRTGISYTQESTRYIDSASARRGAEIVVIEPPMLAEYGDETEDGAGNKISRAQERWRRVMLEIEECYKDLRGMGVPTDGARSVLPLGLKTQIGVTANAREWRHIMGQRLSKKAHPQMRQVQRMVLGHLLDWFPLAFTEWSR